MKSGINLGSPILLTLVFLTSFVNAQSSTVHVYGFSGLQSTRSLLRYLSESDCEVIFHSLNESSSEVSGRKVVETLWLLGIRVAPPTMGHSVCPGCELPLFAYARGLSMRYASPLIGFFRNGRLRAVTLGTIEFGILDKALTLETNGDVIVFAFGNEYSLSGESTRNSLERLLLEHATSGMVTPDIVSSVALLALADSVNPCTFAVFTALLLIALHTLGKAKTLLSGFLFITAVSVSYYILGSGLIHFFGAIPYVDKTVALVGLAIAAFNLMRGLKPKFKSPVPRSVRRFVDRQISRSYVNPTASFALGVAASLTLLPCSSGPYMVGLALLSALKDPAEAHLLLVLYNVIFITPLIIILLAISVSRICARRIKAWRGARLGAMELINGSILAIVCMYILIAPPIS